MHLFVLILTLLVCNATGSLAGRLAGRLAFTTTTCFYTFSKIASNNRLDSFHLHISNHNLNCPPDQVRQARYPICCKISYHTGNVKSAPLFPYRKNGTEYHTLSRIEICIIQQRKVWKVSWDQYILHLYKLAYCRTQLRQSASHYHLHHNQIQI